MLVKELFENNGNDLKYTGLEIGDLFRCGTHYRVVRTHDNVIAVDAASHRQVGKAIRMGAYDKQLSDSESEALIGSKTGDRSRDNGLTWNPIWKPVPGKELSVGDYVLICGDVYRFCVTPSGKDVTLTAAWSVGSHMHMGGGTPDSIELHEFKDVTKISVKYLLGDVCYDSTEYIGDYRDFAEWLAKRAQE